MRSALNTSALATGLGSTVSVGLRNRNAVGASSGDPVVPPAETFFMLAENGDSYIVESGEFLILE